MKKLILLASAAIACTLCSCGNNAKSDSTLGDIVTEEQLDSAAQAASANAINNPAEVTEGAPQNADAEGLLAKYKLLVEQYEQFADKADNADINELAHKASDLAQQINSTQQQIVQLQGSLSDDELTRLSKLSKKFTDAATKVQQAISSSSQVVTNNKLKE